MNWGNIQDTTNQLIFTLFKTPFTYNSLKSTELNAMPNTTYIMFV